MVHETDEELIGQAQAGDPEARDKLLCRYEETIQRVIDEYEVEYGAIDMPLGAVEGRLEDELDQLIDEFRFDYGIEPDEWFHERLFEQLEAYLMSRKGGVQLPENLSTDQTEVESAHFKLEQQLERDPTAEELSEYVEEEEGKSIPEDRVRRILGDEEPVEPEQEPGVSPETFAPAADIPGGEPEVEEESLSLRDVIDEMPEPKRTIVLHSFGLYGHEELSIDELCERFDMGQEEMRSLLQEGERELARHVGEGS